jgi:hypothetical protein
MAGALFAATNDVHDGSASCTTGSASGNSCTITVSWSAPWSDTNYSAVCIPDNATSNANYDYFLSGKTTTTVSITVVNVGLGPWPVTIHGLECISARGY